MPPKTRNRAKNSKNVDTVVALPILGLGALCLCGLAVLGYSQKKEESQTLKQKKVPTQKSVISTKQDLARFLTKKAENSKRKKKYEEAKTYYTQLLDPIIEASDNVLAESHHGLATVYIAEKEYEIAKQELLSAKALLLKINDEKWYYLAQVYDDLYTACYNLKQHHESVDYATKALNLYMEKGAPNHIRIPCLLNILGLANARLGKFTEAEEYFQKSIDRHPKHFQFSFLTVDSRILSEEFLELGQLFIDSDKLIDGLKAFNQMIYQLKNIETTTGSTEPIIAAALYVVGRLYYEQDYYSKAIDTWTESEKKINSSLKLWYPNTYFIANLTCDIIAVHWEIGDLDRAKELEESFKMHFSVNFNFRSKYLQTKSVSLSCSSNPQFYSIEVEIRKQSKHRVPLTQGNLLVFHFQNPESETDPLVVERWISSGENVISVLSPPLPSLVLNGHWFSIQIFIFSDSSKKMKLGIHRQLVKASF